MASKAKSSRRKQYGALPFKVDADGALRILLVTSRPLADRWTIPKGQPIKGLRGPEIAAREALEEAGLSGRILGQKPLGHYEHQKRTGPGTTTRYRVELFALAVDAENDDWPEKGQRELRWVDPEAAARMVAADGLAVQIVLFARKQRRASGRAMRPGEQPEAVAMEQPEEPEEAPDEDAPDEDAPEQDGTAAG